MNKLSDDYIPVSSVEVKNFSTSDGIEILVIHDGERDSMRVRYSDIKSRPLSSNEAIDEATELVHKSDPTAVIVKLIDTSKVESNELIDRWNLGDAEVDKLIKEYNNPKCGWTKSRAKKIHDWLMKDHNNHKNFSVSKLPAPFTKSSSDKGTKYLVRVMDQKYGVMLPVYEAQSKQMAELDLKYRESRFGKGMCDLVNESDLRFRVDTKFINGIKSHYLIYDQKNKKDTGWHYDSWNDANIQCARANAGKLKITRDFSDRVKKLFNFSGLSDSIWKLPSKLMITQVTEDKDSLDKLVDKYRDKVVTVLQFKYKGIVSIYLPVEGPQGELTVARVPAIDSKFAGMNTEYGIIHFTTKKLSELLAKDVQVLGTYQITSKAEILKIDYEN